MPDTREKQKLIELLEYCVDEYVEPDDPYDSLNVDYGNFADNLIVNGVTVQEWISVKDRLELGPADAVQAAEHVAPGLHLDGVTVRGQLPADEGQHVIHELLPPNRSLPPS